MSNITVQEIVKQALQNKLVNVKQIHSFSKRVYPEVPIQEKDINNFLYGEYYGEDFERCQRINDMKFT